MQNILKAFRFVVFGLFITCNAIIASVAVWNYSLAQSVRWIMQIDSYLTFLGASGLVLIFSIIFVELARENATPGKIWFECSWAGIFWIMNLAGGAALSAIGLDRMCSSATPSLSSNKCASSQVLLAFTWISTITLLGYFSVLFILALLYSKEYPRIWHDHVHRFPWSDSRTPLESAPTSPSLPRFLHKVPSIVAPRPQRAAPAALYSYRSGLGPDYEIEHYNPLSPQIDRPAPVAAPPLHPVQSTRQASSNISPSSLYPRYIQPTLISQPVQSHVERPMPPSPPPLGDWPRTNPQSRPKRKLPPPPLKTTMGVPSTRPRPSGPRRRSSSSGALDISEGLANLR